MMQRTSNENAACKHRICKRSDQPKIDRIANNDMMDEIFFRFFSGLLASFLSTLLTSGRQLVAHKEHICCATGRELHEKRPKEGFKIVVITRK